MINKKPISKPACINFSSGPCTKRPGWSVNSLDNALLGRSHRSKEGKIKLKDAIDKTIDILGIPEGYKVGIVAGSDTGAIEMAMWNLLGSKPVEILAWEVFGNDWKKDIIEQLKIPNSKPHTADLVIYLIFQKLILIMMLYLPGMEPLPGLKFLMQIGYLMNEKDWFFVMQPLQFLHKKLNGLS